MPGKTNRGNWKIADLDCGFPISFFNIMQGNTDSIYSQMKR